MTTGGAGAISWWPWRPEDHASSQGEQEGHFTKWDPVPWGARSQGHLPEAVTMGCSEMEVDQQRDSWSRARPDTEGSVGRESTLSSRMLG